MSEYQASQIPEDHGRRCCRGPPRGPLIWVKDAHAQQWNGTPEKGAKLRVLRWSRFVQGDIDQYMKNVQKFTGQDRHRSARRQRGLGGRAAEGRGGGEHRRRPGHHPAARTTTRTSIRRSCVDVTDVCDVPRQEVRRLVSRVRAVPEAGRQEVDRRPARLRGQRDRLPREHAEGGGLRQRPEGHRRLPQAVQGAEGEGHAGRLRARQRHRRRQHVDALGGLGASAARWSTQNNKVVIDSPETIAGARVREGALRRRSCPARCRGSTRTTTRRSSTARSR